MKAVSNRCRHERKRIRRLIRLSFAAAAFITVMFAPVRETAAEDEGKSVAQGRTAGVTYETTGDYAHEIYANGQPLLIVVTDHINYSKLFIDANGNKQGDPGEEITDFKGDGTLAGGGIYYSDVYGGYFLPNTIVYGGAKEGNCVYDTSVTLTGLSDPSKSSSSDNTNNGFSVKMIYGGSKSGVLEGNTCVNISGGNIGWVYGGAGANEGEIHGNITVNVTDGCVFKNTYGGSASGSVNGNTNVSIQGGEVYNVFGGNEMSGKVDGDTNLLFDKDAVVKGWVYGGGAGFDNNIITEITGSTNITINNGKFSHNIYGGGGWRGSSVGNSNVIIYGGKFEGDIYGGGEEASIVKGTASVTINGGEMWQVFAAGAGWNNTQAVVGNADVKFNKGTVRNFKAFNENEGSILTGDLSFSLTGESFSDTYLYFGTQGENKSFKNLSISLKDGKAGNLELYQPVKGNLDISFDNSYFKYFYMAEDILANAGETKLAYKNCGSKENRWEEYDVYFGRYNSGENIFISSRNINKNRFDIISMTDSYIDFLDESSGDTAKGMQDIAGKLVLNGGALRISGVQTSYMPQVVFENDPILLRTSDNGMISFEEGIISGTARIGWLHKDGINVYDWPDTPICCAQSDTPDTTFAPFDENLCLRTDTIWSSSTGFSGKAWYACQEEKYCRCSVYGYEGYLSTDSDEGIIISLPNGLSEKTVTLRDTRQESTADSENCPVVGHKGSYSEFEFSLIPDETTSENPLLDGDRLTVYGAGVVNISVTQKLNNKSAVYSSKLYVVETPESDIFTYIVGKWEDLSLEFKSDEFGGIAGLYNKTNHQWAASDTYSMELEDGIVHLKLAKEYLNSLGEGTYSFDIQAHLGSPSKIYEYNFTINIVTVIEVPDPVIELSEDVFHYDGTRKRPDVTVKDGRTVIPPNEYEVRYENNINVGEAQVIITDKEGGVYAVNGTRSFKIINDYRPEKGVDYTSEPKSNQWTNKDFVITAKDGYLLSYGNTPADKWVTSISRTEETAYGYVTFYVKNISNGRISLAAAEQYKIDKSNIESYDITFNKKSVKKPLEEIAFGTVFNDKIEVEITANDSLSGTDSISYYISENILNEKQLKSITQWTENASFTVSDKDFRKFIIYVKASDKAGNTMYFGSTGAEFKLPVSEEQTDSDSPNDTIQDEETEQEAESVTNAEELMSKEAGSANVNQSGQAGSADANQSGQTERANADKDSDENSPGTNDQNPVLLWIMILAVSGLTAGTGYLTLKKKSYNI